MAHELKAGQSGGSDEAKRAAIEIAKLLSPQIHGNKERKEALKATADCVLGLEKMRDFLRRIDDGGRPSYGRHSLGQAVWTRLWAAQGNKRIVR